MAYPDFLNQALVQSGPAGEYVGGLVYTNILIPVDLSVESSWEKPFPVATALARLFNARLHVITVIRDIDAMFEGRYLAGSYERLINEAARQLAALVTQNIPGEIGATSSVGQGIIYDEILRAAQTLQADLIVMASHRPEMKDYLLGANAARVVRHARCSVFVVRD